MLRSWTVNGGALLPSIGLAAFQSKISGRFRHLYTVMPAQDLSGALRTVLNILDAWDVPPRDRMAMLGCNQEMYNRWITTRELGEIYPDTLERLSYVLGIWKALGTMFPDQVAADS